MASLTSCASTPPVPPAARTELTPTGKLRVGINYGNVLLAIKDPATGEFRGVAPDLARELGRRLGTPVEWVGYESAGKMAEAVKTGAWDVAFLGAEPARAGEIAFSPAYLEIEATYLVPAGSPIRSVTEVDREGIRIAVADKAATAATKAGGLLDNVDGMVTDLRQGKGTAGALLAKDDVYVDVRELLRDLKRNPWKLFWKE